MALPLTFSKSFSSAIISVGQITQLTFTITNPNAFTVSNVAFNDLLPSIIAPTTSSTFSACQGTVSVSTSTNSISLNSGQIGAGQACTFVVDVIGVSPGQQVNTTGQVTAMGIPPGGPASALISVITSPIIRKMFGATSIPIGGSTRLTFTLINPDLSTTLTGVLFTDTLPSGLVIATPPMILNTCGGTLIVNFSSNTINFSGGTISPSDSCRISLDVIATSAGTKVNTTSNITSNEGVGNAATATINVLSLMSPTFSKFFSPSTIALAGTTILTFTIRNRNPLITLTGIRFTDNLPGGLIIATPANIINSCGKGIINANPGSNLIMVTGLTLAPLTSCSISVDIIGTLPGMITNITDPIITNETGLGPRASADIIVQNVILPPILFLSFSPSAICICKKSILTFTITNPNMFTTLTSVSFIDRLPKGLTVQNNVATLNSQCKGLLRICNDTILLTNLTLPPRETCTFSLIVKGTKPGLKNNVVAKITFNESSTSVEPESLFFASIIVLPQKRKDSNCIGKKKRR